MSAKTNTGEDILEPELPIVDPHHHLWDRTPLRVTIPRPAHPFYEAIADVQRYLLEELLADTGGGHNIRATVFLECHAMYRADGPEALKCVGETEFVNGVAAMSASGIYGETRACAGIVGNADLRLGDAVEDVLRAHIHVAGGRFRGIRNSTSHDPDPEVLGPLMGRNEGLYRDANFRAGFKWLHKFGLSFDAWLLEPQLPDLIDLAQAFPDTSIVLDHVGTPLGIASYSGRRDERFPIWRDNIRKLALHLPRPMERFQTDCAILHGRRKVRAVRRNCSARIPFEGLTAALAFCRGDHRQHRWPSAAEFWESLGSIRVVAPPGTHELKRIISQ